MQGEPNRISEGGRVRENQKNHTIDQRKVRKAKDIKKQAEPFCKKKEDKEWKKEKHESRFKGKEKKGGFPKK